MAYRIPPSFSFLTRSKSWKPENNYFGHLAKHFLHLFPTQPQPPNCEHRSVSTISIWARNKQTGVFGCRLKKILYPATHSFLASSRVGLGIWELRNKPPLRIWGQSLDDLSSKVYISSWSQSKGVTRWESAARYFIQGKLKHRSQHQLLVRPLPVTSRSISNSVLCDFSKKTQEISHPRQVPTRCSRSENCSPKIAHFHDWCPHAHSHQLWSSVMPRTSWAAIHWICCIRHYSIFFLVIFCPIRSSIHSLDCSVIFLFPSSQIHILLGSIPMIVTVPSVVGAASLSHHAPQILVFLLVARISVSAFSVAVKTYDLRSQHVYVNLPSVWTFRPA